MRRTVLLVILVALALPFMGCSGQENNVPPQTPNPTEAPYQTPTPTPTPTSESLECPTEENPLLLSFSNHLDVIPGGEQRILV